jgi:hypothetical protein
VNRKSRWQEFHFPFFLQNQFDSSRSVVENKEMGIGYEEHLAITDLEL